MYRSWLAPLNMGWAQKVNLAMVKHERSVADRMFRPLMQLGSGNSYCPIRYLTGPLVGSRGRTTRRGRRGRTRRPRRARRGRSRRPRRRLSGAARLMMPHLSPPNFLSMKFKTMYDQMAVATATLDVSSERTGFQKTLVMNDINTPWSGLIETGGRPHGLAELQARYKKAKIRAVTVDIYIKQRLGLASGVGTFYFKLSDSATVPDVHVTGRTHGADASTGGGFQNEIRQSPRYITRENNYMSTSAIGQGKSLHVRITWTPRKTHLDYPQDGFTQTIDSIGMSPPPILAYLQFGFICNISDAQADQFNIKYAKTFYTTLGNVVQVSAS